MKRRPWLTRRLESDLYKNAHHVGAYYPAAYGANYDGVTEDHEAINAAIMDAHMMGGGDVVIPGGRTVLVNGSYPNDTIRLASVNNVRLRIGEGTRIITNRSNFKAGASVFCAIYARECLDCLIEGGTLEGEGLTEFDSPASFGIVAPRARRLTIREVKATGWVRDGIYISGVGSPYLQSEDVHIENCTCNDNVSSGLAIAHAARVRVIGGRFNDNGKSAGTLGEPAKIGIDIEPVTNQTAEDITIIGATCNGNGLHGVVAGPWPDGWGRAIRVIGCHAETNGSSGFLASRAEDVVFQDCTAKSSGLSGFKAYSSAKKVSVLGCKSLNNTGDGIDFYGIEDAHIANNVVADCDGTGIEARAAYQNHRFVIEQNTVKGCEYGIVATVHNSRVVGNVAIGNQKTGIAVGGAHNIVDNIAFGNGTAADNTYANIAVSGAGHTIIGGNTKMSYPFASGTFEAVGTGTVTLEEGAAPFDDYYNGLTLTTLSGTGSGQTAEITDYVGSTRVATVTFGSAVDTTTTYRVTTANCAKYGLQVAARDCVVLGGNHEQGGKTADELIASGSNNGAFRTGITVAGGNLVMDNTRGVWIKDAGGTSREILSVSAADNVYLKTPNGGDIYAYSYTTPVLKLTHDGHVIVYGTGTPPLRHNGDADTGIDWPTGNILRFICGGAAAAQVDANATAGESRFSVWDVTAGAVKRVSFGANDSGGAGYKVMRVAN